MAVKQICEDCGALFEAVAKADYCPKCRHERFSKYAKERNLNKLGNAAYSKQQAEKRRCQ